MVGLFKKMLARAARKAVRQLWLLNCRFGRTAAIDRPERVTVIIPSYSLARARHLQSQVCSILKCDFVERVIVSNHNPDKDVAEWVWSDDPRVTLINQPGRRGCGYGWIVASQADADYFIVADDDLLLFPQQFATLFERLLAAPERPHGLAGVAGGRYYQRREMEVDNLFQIYAITRAHLARYLELVNAIGGRGDGLAEAIEFWADDILISRSGLKKSAIHDAGPILRCDTASAPGVATFQAATFAEQRVRVRQALDQQGAIPNAGSGGDIPLANQA